VSPSGAADRASAARANALARNPAPAALLEVTLGGLALRAVGGGVDLGLAGADVGAPEQVHLDDGAELRLGRPAVGVRTYVAVRGGIAVPPVLGSRSTDLLSGLGPPPVARDDLLPVGDDGPVDVDLPLPTTPRADLLVPLLPGPRADHVHGDALALLAASPYVVSPRSNRVALRLEGVPLPMAGSAELASEGLVRGAVQVPPSGQPVLFLADHPVTGGYPVVAVVPDAAVDAAAQARPGTRITFVRADSAR
jgi:biotin-dependent carboxylase-like uncharacterized protein